MAKVRRRQRPKTERELSLLLSTEECLLRLMRREFSGFMQRYQFLKEPLTRLRTERLVLEEAMNGNPVAVRRRAGRADGSDRLSVG